MNSRNFLSWLLVLLAVCGLALAGFSAGVVTAACEWGCVNSGSLTIDIYDPSYDLVLTMPHNMGVELLTDELNLSGPYCGTSANLACDYVYADDSVETWCAPYYNVLREISGWEQAAPIGTFNIPGCTTCT